MVASVSLQLIVVLVLLALALALAIVWARRQRHPSSPDELSTPAVPRASAPEPSEQQLLWGTLSQREEQIARLAAEDRTDDEIARELHLSVRTVQNHLQHAREKLHIHSRHEFKYLLQHLGDELMTATK